MKSFTTLVFAASLALTSAQYTYNETTGVFTCAQANAAYCAGDSLSTNIIIRCNGFVGQPGNCNDNLDGDFPFGLSFAPCYQTSPTSGEAACSKNCIVYGGSGTINGTFSIPGCVPSTTQSTSASATSTASASSSPASSISIPLTTVTYSYTTVTVPCNSTTSPTILPTLTTSHAPNSSGGAPTSFSNSTVTTSSGPNGSGAPSSISNTTAITSSGSNGGSGGNGGNGGSATATPVGPTTSAPAPFTGAAAANQAGAFLVAAGLFVAALL